jgi:aldehyde:ferredoxin oxidoreductase
MPKGYCGRILHIDLSSQSIEIERPDEAFYRTYVGGSCLAAYYVFKGMSAGVDALDPENVLVFAASPTTGAPVSGASRFNVTAKSPLTGTMGDSQAGGFWGPELKAAGFDAVVIRGAAARPVYLWIHDGECEVRDASHLWGTFTKQAQQAIRDELGDQRVRVALIGPGGESLVRYACIANEPPDVRNLHYVHSGDHVVDARMACG